MKPRDILLAVLASVIWGLSFLATRWGVESFTAAQLTALRFFIACIPVLLLPRPRISWPLLIATGATLFLGQFFLVFLAFRYGMPAGLASATQQVHVFFTVLMAAIFMHEIPTRRQTAGIVVAFSGLVLIAFSAGVDLPLIALGLALSAAFSWGIGNILLKHASKNSKKPIPMVPLMAWLSLVPPLPALALSYFFDTDASLLDAVTKASWISLASVIYLGTVSTVLAYAIWGHLLTRYPAAVVTPFSLLVPCTGILASAIVFGEVFPPIRYGGMALILAGLAIVVLPGSKATPKLIVPPA